MVDWYRWALIIVALHLTVLVVHTAAHLALSILPQAVDLVFILTVFFVLPIGSVAVLRRMPRAAWILLIAFVTAFLYGAFSHFVLSGPDNAFALPAGAWAAVFQATTVGLAVLEGLGIGAGLALTMRTRTPSAPAAPPA